MFRSDLRNPGGPGDSRGVYRRTLFRFPSAEHRSKGHPLRTPGGTSRRYQLHISPKPVRDRWGSRKIPAQGSTYGARVRRMATVSDARTTTMATTMVVANAGLE
ncbi:hypothetical protein GCM10009832_07970 [Dietzia kunjamensis subsp. schimae]